MSTPTVDWTVPGTVETEGLRERKKRLMRQQLSDTATQMFMERGFDAVRVTDIAAAYRIVTEAGGGVVDCEVLEVNEPSLLRWSWIGDEGGDVTEVTYRLERHAGGTRFTYDHTGFTGVGGVFMAKLLGHVRRKMLTVGLPAVLDEIDDDGALRSA